MTAREFVEKTISWTDRKRDPHSINDVMLGVIFGKSLTKGKRQLKICACGQIIDGNRKNWENLNWLKAKKLNVVESLIDFLSIPHRGVKGYKGRFTLIDFRKEE